MIRIPGARRCGAVGRTGRPGLRGALGLVLVAALLTPGPAGGAPLSQAPAGPAPQLPGGESQLFPETGFRLGAPATDPFGEYFAARGGVAAFGYPVSRRFTLQGHRVQVFQRAVMQQQPAGVGLLNLLDEGYLPYTDFGTAAVPPLDPAVAAAAPPPGTPDYGAAVSAYVAQAVPNVWQGQPVGFRDAFLRAAGQPADAPALQVLVALEVLGFPTSAPAADPRNPLFVYQRFQRAVLQYDATTGLTQPLLLADFLKSVMTGRDLPPDLATQAQGTRFFLQYRPGTAGWVARPADLPDTDLTQAFEPDEAPAGALPAASPRPEAPLPPPPAAVTRPSATRPSGTLALTPPPPFPAPSGTPGPATATATATATPTGNPQVPVVEGAEPGGAAVGQDVLLRGRHFGDQPGQVLFTGKLAQAQVWSNTLIVVTVPQGAADGTVRVRRADGALSNAVGFAPATTATPSPTGTTPTATPSPTPTPTPGRPTVAGIEPHFGGVGSAVLVRGAGFGSTTGTVLLGSQTAPVQLWSDTSVLVLVPTGADTQPQRTQRLRVLRADGATGEPVSCFVVSPGTPTPTPSGGAPATPVPVTPTPVPPPPPGC